MLSGFPRGLLQLVQSDSSDKPTGTANWPSCFLEMSRCCQHWQHFPRIVTVVSGKCFGWIQRLCRWLAWIHDSILLYCGPWREIYHYWSTFASSSPLFSSSQGTSGRAFGQVQGQPLSFASNLTGSSLTFSNRTGRHQRLETPYMASLFSF